MISVFCARATRYGVAAVLSALVQLVFVGGPMLISIAQARAWLGQVGGFAFFLCGFYLMFSLMSGRVFTRWLSSSKPERESHPDLYRFCVTIFLGGALIGAALYLQSLI